MKNFDWLLVLFETLDWFLVLFECECFRSHTFLTKHHQQTFQSMVGIFSSKSTWLPNSLSDFFLQCHGMMHSTQARGERLPSIIYHNADS